MAYEGWKSRKEEMGRGKRRGKRRGRGQRAKTRAPTIQSAWSSAGESYLGNTIEAGHMKERASRERSTGTGEQMAQAQRQADQLTYSAVCVCVIV